MPIVRVSVGEFSSASRSESSLYREASLVSELGRLVEVEVGVGAGVVVLGLGPRATFRYGSGCAGSVPSMSVFSAVGPRACVLFSRDDDDGAVLAEEGEGARLLFQLSSAFLVSRRPKRQRPCTREMVPMK